MDTKGRVSRSSKAKVSGSDVLARYAGAIA